MGIRLGNAKGLKVIIDMTKGYFLTTVINQAIPFLILPILTRFLTTAEYGNLSLFSFYHFIAFCVVGSPLATYITKLYFEKDSSFLAKVVGNSIYLSFILTILLEAILFLSFPIIQDYLALPLFWMAMIPLGAFANVIYWIGLTICRNGKKVLHFSLNQIGNTIFNVSISLVLVCLFYYGWFGRAIGMVMSYIISALIFLIYLQKAGFLNLRFDRDTCASCFRYIMPLIPNALQVVIISQIGLFFMQLYFTKELLGLYSLGFQLAFCLKLFVDTLVMSWHPFMYEQLSLGNKLDKIYLFRLLMVLNGMIVLAAIALVALAKPVLWLMTTPDYYGADEFVPWFVLGLLFYGVSKIMEPILIKYNQQNYIGKVSFYTTIVMVLVNIYFPKLFGYMGSAYAFCVVYSLLSLCLLIRSVRLFRFRLGILKVEDEIKNVD